MYQYDFYMNDLKHGSVSLLKTWPRGRAGDLFSGVNSGLLRQICLASPAVMPKRAPHKSMALLAESTNAFS